MGKSLVVIGANSAIAKACIQARAPFLRRVALCARNADALRALVEDLGAKYPALSCRSWVCDVEDLDLAQSTWAEMARFCEGVDEVVYAPGILGLQTELEQNPLAAMELITLNSAVATLWILMAANTLEAQREGALAIITSVAGVRGRASNYVYGSSKAQLIALAEGLRCRLDRVGVRVIDFRPGIVDTPMTAKIKKGALTASSETVGRELARSLKEGAGIVYAPPFWRAIMGVIRHLPFGIFKKLKI